MKSQVTTKCGDQGTTRTFGGDVLSKGHPILECTGRLEELRAHLARIRLRIIEDQPAESETLSAFLFWLLHCCFLIGAEVNDPLRKHPEFRRGEIGRKYLDKLEAELQRLEALTPLPRAFIATASTLLAAEADVAAAVARAFERSLVRLKESTPGFEAVNLLAFSNRLSDYLYILARHLEGGRHIPVDYHVLEG